MKRRDENIVVRFSLTSHPVHFPIAAVLFLFLLLFLCLLPLLMPLFFANQPSLNLKCLLCVHSMTSDPKENDLLLAEGMDSS